MRCLAGIEVGGVMRDRFKQIREYYGLSQAQFAQRINMSPGFISNVETGRSNISEKTIDVVCRIFLINREWLFWTLSRISVCVIKCNGRSAAEETERISQEKQRRGH